MPPFRYTPNQNRYVGSIADLMGRGNEAEARALIASANAQAQAAQASGQAWGGAVQGIGNTIAAIPGQMQAAEDRARVMEERERADQSRAMRADIFNTAPGHTIGPTIDDGTPLSPPPPGPMDGMPGFGRAEINPPGMSGFGTASIVDGPGAASEALNPAAGDVQGGDVAEGLELPNRYRTTDANGSDIFDLEQIIAAFASAGLDAPDMSPYLAINQEISSRFDQSLANARGVARTLLEGPEGAWEQGLRTSLGVYEANGLLPAPMLASMRTQLEDIASLPPEEKEARLGQLLHQLTGDASPEPVIARPGSMLLEREYPSGPKTITPLGEEDLTAQEQAHEAYARDLYPDHEGPNARSRLTDEDFLAYNTRQANLGESRGSTVWTDRGLMRITPNGTELVLGDDGNPIQPRDTSASRGMPSTEWGLIVAASDPAHPRHQQSIDALALKSERDRDRPPTATAILSAEMQMEGKFRSEMTSHREIERQFNIMRSGLRSLEDNGLKLLEFDPIGGDQTIEFGEDGFMLPGGIRHTSANAASQAILVTFQKILDPDSVVRESEYARSKQGIALMDRIRGQWMQMTEGGAGVPVSELKAFVALASNWVDASRESATRIKNMTSDAATRMHLNPENITYSYDERWVPTSDDAQGDSDRQSF